MLPLVSFCVKSYNQVDLLKWALIGAFAQTYRPLEIVISDDCSSDGSWEYIQSAVKEFERKVQMGLVPANVTVVINRNEKNLGNLGNWQKCGELAHGELCIKADGDDVSLPNRTSRCVEEWLKAGGKDKVKVITHNAWNVDYNGVVFGQSKLFNHWFCFGCVSAWTRDCFNGFHPIVESKAADDVVFSFRAYALDGKSINVDDNLVFYRFGSGATTSCFASRLGMTRIKSKTSDELAFKQVFAEISDFEEPRRSLLMDRAKDIARNKFAVFELKSARTFAERWRSYKIVTQHTCGCVKKIFFALYLFPFGIGNVLNFPFYLMRYFIDAIRFSKIKHPKSIAEFFDSYNRTVMCVS